jgi:hypothetical protein
MLLADQLAIDALAILIVAGMGFLLWSLIHLLLESRQEKDAQEVQLDRPRRSEFTDFPARPARAQWLRRAP